VKNDPLLTVFFYKTTAGNESVREWLLSQSNEDKKTIGVDIKTVQFGWPMGMPLVRKLERGLWEIRSDISTGIARVIFTVVENRMVLLHGFIKKSQKTPLEDMSLARKRLSDTEK
jgi:phage-related protein